MNFRDGQAIYLQIAERIIDEILAGKYLADQRIPGVRDYSSLLQVNINTTVKAYETLTQRGIIYNRRGLGFFVSQEATQLIHEARKQSFLDQQLPDLARSMRQLDISLDEMNLRLQQLLSVSHVNNPQIA